MGGRFVEREPIGLEEIAAALRRRREERGISLADAQTATRIRTKYLQALEEGNVAALPEPVYVRGFLRAYADYLGLDGHSLVESFDHWRRETGGASGASGEESLRVPAPAGARRASPPPGAPPRLTAARRPGGAPRPRRRRTAGRWLAAVGLILALLYAVGLWPEGRPGPTGPAGDRTGLVDRPGAAGAPAGGGEPTEGAADGEAGPGSGEGVPAAGGAAGGMATDGGTGPAGGEAAPAPALDVRQAAYGRRWEVGLLAPVPALEVVVRVADRCWVRAVGDDRVLFEGILSAGEERRFTGTGSVRLRLGNTAAATVTVNGRPLPALGSEPVDVVVSAFAGAATAESPAAPGRP